MSSDEYCFPYGEWRLFFWLCGFPVDTIMWMLKSGTFREISVRGGNINPNRRKEISTPMTTRKEGVVISSVRAEAAAWQHLTISLEGQCVINYKPRNGRSGYQYHHSLPEMSQLIQKKPSLYLAQNLCIIIGDCNEITYAHLAMDYVTW